MSSAPSSFASLGHLGVIACQRVKDGAPILYVSHDDDGDWQFLCGGDHGDGDADQAVLLGVSHVVEADPSIDALAGLPCGAFAERESPSAPWSITDPAEEFIRKAVEQHGWSVQLIPPGDGPNAPPFAYTVGLHRSLGSPELIIFGLAQDVMQRILNGCGAHVRSGGSMKVGEELTGIIRGYPLRVRKVESAESIKEHAGYALWFNSPDPFELFQVLWPDKQGRFPGEDGVDPVIAQRQPLLP